MIRRFLLKFLSAYFQKDQAWNLSAYIRKASLYDNHYAPFWAGISCPYFHRLLSKKGTPKFPPSKIRKTYLTIVRTVLFFNPKKCAFHWDSSSFFCQFFFFWKAGSLKLKYVMPLSLSFWWQPFNVVPLVFWQIWSIVAPSDFSFL